jgi:hypothetical protein
MGIPLSFAFAVSSTSDACVPKLLRSHIAFLMASVIQMWAPSRMLGLMLLALSPKGLLTYKRMMICSLGLCLPIGLCTIALIMGRIGHQESFFYHRARRMWRGGASRPFVVRSPSHGMNTCEPKKARFVDGFYDTLSSELGHAHEHAYSVSYVGPRHASCGACVGSSPMTSKDFCLFVCVSTRLSLRVAPLRHGSKSVRKPFHSNQHFHHANPHDKLSALLTRVTKYWIPKYVLANPLGSKARSFSSPCV